MKPVLQALLVADHIYVDKITGKKIVAGIFHRMMFAKAQAVQSVDEGAIRIEVPLGGQQSGSPFCYISLTEVRGKQPFTLRYVNLEDDKPLFQTEFEIECNNPLETVEAVFPLPRFPADKPGHFALELLWGQEPLGCHRITVAEIAPNEG